MLNVAKNSMGLVDCKVCVCNTIEEENLFKNVRSSNRACTIIILGWLLRRRNDLDFERNHRKEKLHTVYLIESIPSIKVATFI